MRGQVRDEAENLATYLRDISRIPLMSREEEESCAREAAAGSDSAKRQLVQANLRFVVTVARQYRGIGLPLADLIGEGNIGLMAAAERYDVTRGTHFISYAAWWIRQAIRKAIAEKGRMIRLPSARAAQLRRIEREFDEGGGANLSESAMERLSQELGVSPSRARDLLALRSEPVSLDAPAGSDPDSPILADTVADTSRPLPDEAVLRDALRQEVESILRALGKREAEILRYRCGLGGRSAMSLQEVGDIFHLTKERIRQIEKRALRKLRRRREAERLGAYVG